MGVKRKVNQVIKRIPKIIISVQGYIIKETESDEPLFILVTVVKENYVDIVIDRHEISSSEDNIRIFIIFNIFKFNFIV